MTPNAICPQSSSCTPTPSNIEVKVSQSEANLLVPHQRALCAASLYVWGAFPSSRHFWKGCILQKRNNCLILSQNKLKRLCLVWEFDWSHENQHRSNPKNIVNHGFQRAKYLHMQKFLYSLIKHARVCMRSTTR